MNKGANGEREGATVVEERREEGREGRGRDEGGGGVTRCRINSDVTSTVPTPTCDRSDSDTSARCACVCGRLDVYRRTGMFRSVLYRFISLLVYGTVHT